MANDAHRTAFPSADSDVLSVLVQRYRSGDQRALDQLMKSMRPLVVKAVRSFVTASADVDDAVQETWLAFVRSGHRIEDPRCVKAWLWTTATNAARRVSMQRARNPLVDDFELVAGRTAAVVDDIDARLITGEQRLAVLAALADGPDFDRELLTLLMDHRELAYDEISALTHRPVGSLGPTRDRAIRRLRRHPCVIRVAEAPTAA